MYTADRNHWRIIRDKKSSERKELKNKNDDIYRKFRSPTYTEAQREIYRQEWERQEKAIEKLEEEIYIYDCKLRQKSPDRNVHVDRGRSKTPGPTALNAVQVPAEQRSRSASRLPRKRLNYNEDSIEVAELERQIDNLNKELRKKDTVLNNLEYETIPQLRRERDKYKAEVLEKIRFYDEIQTQLEESERRSRQSSAKCQERLLEYQEENRHLRDEMSKISKQHQPLRQKIVEAEGKTSSLSGRLRIESEEKSRLKRENTLLQTQLNSIKREREWNDESYEKNFTKIIEENDRLKEELLTYQRECFKVDALQQNEIEMRQQLDEMKKKNENLEREKRENETTLLSSRNQNQEMAQLQSVIRSKEVIEKRLRQVVGSLEKKCEALQQRETDMTLTIDDITKRNEQLRKEKSADDYILKSIHDHKAKITQLQSDIRSKEVVEDGLRQKIAGLERKCEALQRDIYERLYDMEERDKKKKQLKEKHDEELQRLRQLEIAHENDLESMKSNHTDLEKKNQQLLAEKDILLRKESMQQKETGRLQKKLDAEQIESAVLRERIKEIERQNLPRHDLGLIAENRRLLEEAEKLKTEFSECKQKSEQHEREIHQVSVENERELTRLRRSENDYKNKVETLKNKLAELQENYELLGEERDRLLESKRKNGDKLQRDLDDANKEKIRLQDQIKKLDRQTAGSKVDLTVYEENSRLKEELKQLRIEVQKSEFKISDEEEKIRSYKMQIETHQRESEQAVREKQGVVARLKETEENMRRHITQVETLQREKRQAIAEKESALTRLSALAGDRLRDNNAAIADLSDENRPINLGEKFSELYDNQWTDAIEKLEELMSERDAIQKLLQMIKDIYDVCRKLAKDQLDEIAKAFGFEERKEKMKRLKDFRKSMASESIGDIKKKVDALCVSKTFSRESSHCSSYISRSVELCWYMCIQDPPVILEFNATHGQVFDDKIYRHFTKSGKTIDYMVWPVMYLHSNGPLLQKGVVQPI